MAEEHYVSSFVRSRMFALLQAYQTGGNRGPLVFTACAPEEWHEVGVLLVSVFLARRGLVVRYLGPSLPLEGLAAIAARHHPAAIVLSAQSPETARKLRASVTLLEGSEPRPLLFFGGQAFNADPRLRARTPGTYIGPDAAAAAATVVEQVTNRSGAPRRRGAQRRPVVGNDRRRTLARIASAELGAQRSSSTELLYSEPSGDTTSGAAADVSQAAASRTTPDWPATQRSRHSVDRLVDAAWHVRGCHGHPPASKWPASVWPLIGFIPPLVDRTVSVS